MFQTLIDSSLRSVVAFVLLLVLSRLIGRKAISQMTFFDFAVGITLGSVTANLALGSQSTPISAAATLITLSLLVILIGYVHIKSFRGRKILNAEPVVVIENGTIINENMKKMRFSTNDLTSLLREKNVFNIADVEFAIMENDGKLSVQPKSQKQPLTPSDLNMNTSYKGLTKDLIIDGNIMFENLNDSQLDETWIRDQLKNQGIQDINDVFYAGLDTSGSLYVSKKIKSKERHGQYGID